MNHHKWFLLEFPFMGHDLPVTIDMRSVWGEGGEKTSWLLFGIYMYVCFVCVGVFFNGGLTLDS